MAVTEFLLALALGVVLALLFVAVAGRRGPGPAGGLVFFLLLFVLLIWAGGAYLQPTPRPEGLPWLTFVLVAAALFLFAAALTTQARRVGSPAERATPDPALPPPGEAGGPGSIRRVGPVAGLGATSDGSTGMAGGGAETAEGDGDGSSLLHNGEEIGIGLGLAFWLLTLLLVIALVWRYW